MSRASCPPIRRFVLAAGLISALGPAAARAQSSEVWRAMNRPVEPLRLVGNLHYVGASDVTSFLITTPEGHVLIDGGFEETVPLIRAAVERLGFDLSDVRILLNSHAHFDHAGGLARLKELTGAKLMASEQDAPLLERGGRGDDVFGDGAPYPPVAVDRRLADGDTVELGGVKLTARITPGHTRGCTSWTTEIEDGGRSLLVVSVCSLTVLEGVQLLHEPTYPGIADDFRRSFEILGALPADVFLASHASFFRMDDKRARRAAGESGNPFVDPEGYRGYLTRARKRFEERLERERVEGAPAALRSGN